MSNRWIGKTRLAGLLLVSLLASMGAAGATQQNRPRYGGRQTPAGSGVIPENTIISVRMDSTLTSRSNRVGDRFTATVTVPVIVDGARVIPAGAIVEGHVTQVTPARRMARSGIIAVEFDNLILPDGSRLALDASLTSDDPEIRRQIDDENRVSGRNDRRTGVFIGGGGVIGAVLGAIGGGAKGAVVGGAAGAGAVIASILFSKGEEARVPSGTPFGVQLRRTLAIQGGTASDPVATNNRNDNTYPDQRDPVVTDNRAGRQPDETQPERQPRDDRQPIDDRASRRPVDVEPEPEPADTQPSRQPAEPPSSRQPIEPASRENAPNRDENDSAAAPPPAAAEPLPLNSPEMTRRAQAALRDEGYYEGEVADQWSPRSTTSLKTYQREHKLPESGTLDDATAKNLGLNGARPVSQVKQPQKPSVTRPETRSTPDTLLANVLSATATRAVDGAVYILINVQANTGGWRWYGDSVVNGDTLDVYARAVRPTGIVTQALTRGKIELTVREGVQHVRRVVIHSAGADQEIALGRATPATTSNPDSTSSPAGETLANMARSLQSRAGDLLAEHKRQLGMSGDNSGRSSYSDADVELLFALNSFANAANLYAGFIGNLQDAQSKRQATLDLARQARRTDRTIAVSTSRNASVLLPRWDVIRQDVLRLMRMFDISTSDIEN